MLNCLLGLEGGPELLLRDEVSFQEHFPDFRCHYGHFKFT
jgi:hypothetical protein